MPDIRCSHCGKENPDFLDVCQFCQSPLKSESMLQIGQKPTKKTTGELEGVLPDWLKNARQQSRDTAAEDAALAAAEPKVQKEEPLDLLAGLAFQSGATDDAEVPVWLSSINPTAKSKPATPVSSPAPTPETDFFAQFNQNEPAQEIRSKPAEEPTPPVQPAADRDELSDWFIQASEQTDELSNATGETSHADWRIDEAAAFQAEDTPAPKEAEDLSWLHNLESAAKQTDELKSPKTPDWASDVSASSQSSGDDDLSWLNNLGSISAPEQPAVRPAQPSQPQEDLSWLNNLGAATPEPPASQPEKPKEDLSWLNAFSNESAEAPPPAQAESVTKGDRSWLDNLNAPAAQESSQSEVPKEDLSWLNAFSASAEASPPAPSQPAAQEDLDWLNKLGGTPAEPQQSQPATPQEDLSWLSAFGSQAPQSTEAAQPSSQEDMSWLSALGGDAPPTTPAAQQSSTEDLSWLNAFGDTPTSTQPAAPSASQDDLGWLGSLQSEPEPDTLSAAPFAEQAEGNEPAADVPHASPFMPRKTAPLEPGVEESMPDWLKSATEGPSMPMGVGALDQFREDFRVPTAPEEAFSWKSFTQEAKPADERPTPTPQDKPEQAFFDPDFFAPAGETSTTSESDVNALFSMEMPDWLSQPEPANHEDASQPIGIHAEGGEALAPVDLPSWVQAMRPMDAVVADPGPSVESQPTERDGPLAGFRGLIPVAPMGSARRPKAISLKLQASDEQQASASLLEQLLAGETSPRPSVTAPVLASQRALRWVLSGAFILVLGIIISLRSQIFTPSAHLPVGAQEVSNVITGLPEGANVLVVVDYEPAVAGEMEAVSGPLLDQLAMMRHPRLTFVSTSPNGSGLVERLISNTNLSKPDVSGLNYQAGQDYFNLGYLAAAETGVLTFIQSPDVAMPSANVTAFSEYSAVLVLSDHAESARVWIEQLQNVKQRDSSVAPQPLLVASSAQAGPLLQPYVLSRQINGLVSGLADASRFEYLNNGRPGLALSYLDAFAVGLLMAVAAIVLGSLWSIFAAIRARRAEVAEG